MRIVSEPHWLEVSRVLELHHLAIVRYGGVEGVRDLALLESALARPRTLYGYDPSCSYVDLATAYAFGIARNHPFIDGNKRTAASALFLFLYRHSLDFDPPDDSLATMIESSAAGTLTEEDLAHQVARWTKPLEP